MKNRRHDLKENGIVSSIILFTITIVVTTLLATVNQFTEPVIALHDIEVAEISHAHVFASAASFTDRSAEFIGPEDTQIITVFDALDADGKVLGAVFETIASGYAGDVKVMTAVTTELEIVGLAVLTNNETPGLGTKVTAKKFTDKFIGNPAGVKFTLKAEESDLTKIDGITGATFSSRAVVNAANTALDFAEKIMDDLVSGGDTNG